MKKLLLLFIIFASFTTQAQTALIIDDVPYTSVGNPVFSTENINGGRQFLSVGNWNNIESMSFRSLTATSFQMTFSQPGPGRLVEFWVNDVDVVGFNEGEWQTVRSTNGVFPFLVVYN